MRERERERYAERERRQSAIRYFLQELKDFKDMSRKNYLLEQK